MAVGGRVLFEDLSFNFASGAIIGVVGRNGCGKSSLFKLLAGDEKPTKGEVVRGSSVSLGLVPRLIFFPSTASLTQWNACRWTKVERASRTTAL